MRSKLSIVLCTYNGAEFLQEQLDSFLAQTRLPDEIVVGDDASRDQTSDILGRFAEVASVAGVGVRLMQRSANVGFVANFSNSLQQATGDVIFLCDQDDVWRCDKLAVMEARFIAEPDLAMLCSDARLVDAKGKPIGETLFGALELDRYERETVRSGRAFDVLLRRSMVTGATAALRRDVLQQALPIGRGWIHDEWLAIVLSATGRVGMVEDQLIDYRQHASNQVGMRKRNLWDKWRDLTRARTEQFEAEVARLRSLEEHLAGMTLLKSSEYLLRVAQRRDHFEVRVALGGLPRWKRVSIVWREALRGNYKRYGTGRRSMLRDLLRHG